MNIKVLVATTKEYRFPEDSMYIPIQGGKALHQDVKIDGAIGDDTGDNISVKNASYCELTSLYWAWKNLNCDYLGLCHYRRMFGSPYKKNTNKWDRILSQSETEKLLERAPVILTKKRNYHIESLYSHYGHTHNAVDLKLTRTIIEEKCPEYLYTFDCMMNKTSAHMFNMFIMKKEYVDEYCEWLFDILEIVEQRLDVSGYSDHDKRVFGRISELLLDVYIVKNGLEYNEVPLLFMENPHWIKKGIYFLKSKYLSGKKL